MVLVVRVLVGDGVVFVCFLLCELLLRESFFCFGVIERDGFGWMCQLSCVVEFLRGGNSGK